MKKIVITGGPCAGKSTVIEAIAEEFGNRVVVVPEVATALFEAGFPPPNPWTQEWQDALQAAIIVGQYRFEARAEAEARDNGCQIIICDRGILDGAAYLQGGVEEFCGRFDVDEGEILSRYEAVIHLESLSTLDPELYRELAKSNPSRFEDIAMAEERELNLRRAWSGHKNRMHLSADIEASTGRVREIINRNL